MNEDLLAELARGVELTFSNAEQLFVEASQLREIGALNRALFLHQISMEECAKIDILGAWATSLLMGHEVNPRKILGALANHRAKNRTNAYMLKVSEAELAARDNKDWDQAAEAFAALQAEFHSESNNAKNASLYVDFDGEKFVSPDERITEKMVAGIAQTNAEFLGHAQLKTRMLHKWKEDTSVVERLLDGFEERLEALNAEHQDDLSRVPEALMDELLAKAMEIKNGETSSGTDSPS